ncbi:MAG TPA: hypothetical protein VFV83_08885 [Chthoniobacteraceae bacterium]|nr:hypothetical protein [Chthoniobacteraceae bacterium]
MKSGLENIMNRTNVRLRNIIMRLRSSTLLIGAVALFRGATLFAEDFQGSTHPMPFDEPPLNYSGETPNDRIAQLQKQIASGEVKLEWDEQTGYLRSLLEKLKISKSSQMLVFSQTSLQRREINPRNPRAIYYNDDIYVGYIPGAPMMEVSAVDPKLGGMFYSIEQEKRRKAAIVRNQECLQCHVSARTMGVPGHFVRSVQTDGGGEIKSGSDAGEITHCAPLEQRWGGWYVTGQHGAQQHLGNLIGASAFDRHVSERGFRGNLKDLTQLIDTSKYLSPRSDIVALMVLEHQLHMHNYITRLNYETRLMMSAYGHIRYLDNQVNAFLRYLLFTEETPLTESIHGDPDFVAQFVAQGPRDAKGRSLRDLDMQTRMFKFPCSFLIYSKAFDSIPDIMREHLLKRLHAILTDTDKDPQFANLGSSERRAILEILQETKPNLPEYWRAKQSGPVAKN